jgi:hypothetical protein
MSDYAGLPLMSDVERRRKETGMRKTLVGLAACIVASLVACAWLVTAAPDSMAEATSAPATSLSIDLATGWTPLQVGEARGTIVQDAKHPTNHSPHLLLITVTKTADPGEGRAGAISGIDFSVDQGEWRDVAFSAVTERFSVGLVFSLENSDGKVLARTTLPEIGGARAGRRRRTAGPTTAPVAWTKYLVSLHVRASDPNAHMVITPIEPTNIWLDGLTLTPRPAGN